MVFACLSVWVRVSCSPHWPHMTCIAKNSIEPRSFCLQLSRVSITGCALPCPAKVFSCQTLPIPFHCQYTYSFIPSLDSGTPLVLVLGKWPQRVLDLPISICSNKGAQNWLESSNTSCTTEHLLGFKCRWLTASQFDTHSLHPENIAMTQRKGKKESVVLNSQSISALEHVFVNMCLTILYIVWLVSFGQILSNFSSPKYTL